MKTIRDRVLEQLNDKDIIAVRITYAIKGYSPTNIYEMKSIDELEEICGDVQDAMDLDYKPTLEECMNKMFLDYVEIVATPRLGNESVNDYEVVIEEIKEQARDCKREGGKRLFINWDNDYSKIGIYCSSPSDMNFMLMEDGRLEDMLALKKHFRARGFEVEGIDIQFDVDDSEVEYETDPVRKEWNVMVSYNIHHDDEDETAIEEIEKETYFSKEKPTKEEIIDYYLAIQVMWSEVSPENYEGVSSIQVSVVSIEDEEFDNYYEEYKQAFIK